MSVNAEFIFQFLRQRENVLGVKVDRGAEEGGGLLAAGRAVAVGRAEGLGGGGSHFDVAAFAAYWEAWVCGFGCVFGHCVEAEVEDL